MTVQPPFKYDVVGSFLRPDYLKKAREEFANKTIDAKQLKAIEDKASQKKKKLDFKLLQMENSEEDIGI